MDASNRSGGYFSRARIAVMGFALLMGAVAALMHVMDAPATGKWLITVLAATNALLGILAPERWCRRALSWSVLTQDMDQH